MPERKIVITVAPVGPAHLSAVANPLTPEKLAADVLACREAGAAQVHLHVRDEMGAQTEDLSVFQQSTQRIRRDSDIIIQGSTGGLSTLTREQRCVCLADPLVEVASLNMGCVNFGEAVYINTLDEIRYWAGLMQNQRILPELEIFEPGMIENGRQMIREKILPPNNVYSFSLNIGPLQATPASLSFLSSLIPQGSLWGLIQTGMTDLTMLATAIGLGASHIRVGFEDSIYYAPGKIARTNAELVRQTTAMIRALGLDVATPDEARLMFHSLN